MMADAAPKGRSQHITGHEMSIKNGFVFPIVILVLFQVLPFHFTSGSDNDVPPVFDPDLGIVTERTSRIEGGCYNDSDGNRIDDHIDHFIRRDPLARFDVFVNYNRGISDEHLPQLRSLHLVPAFVSKYIDTVLIEDVGLVDISSVLGLPDVLCVENAPMVYPMLDVSVGAVKAKHSDTYSLTVWEDLGLTGEDVNVALIDSGADDSIHAGLRGKFVWGVDTSSQLGYVERNPDDGVGHGTHCAGIIMGTGSDTDDIGVAPNASLVDCKVGDVATLGAATPANFMEGLEWVRENADRYNISVLSISMGTEATTDGTDAYARLANQVVEAGVTVVVAIGNDDNSNNANVVSSPGSADKVITVGALNERDTVEREDDTIARYSQQGPRPSDGDNDDIDELKPDLVAPGTGISSCMYNTRSNYITFSGTSMSTPHVSGVVALMKQAYPSLKPSEIKEVLRHSSEKKGTSSYPDRDDKYNTLYGWGMMDAYGAVRRAKDLSTPGLNMPSYVDSGSRFNVRAKMDIGRTSYMENRETIKWNVAFPDFFSPPDNITVSTSPGAEAEVIWQTPYVEDGNWNIDVQIDILSSNGDLVEVAPEIEFNATAPHVAAAQEFGFTLNTSLNDVFSPERTHVLTVGASAEHKPDLSIDSNDISFSKNPANAGDEVTIYANVSNVGLSDVYSADVNFYDGNPTSGILIGTDEIDVPATSICQARITWEATSGPIHNIFVVVDPDDEIDEISEINNTASRPLRVSGGVNLAPDAALSATPIPADINEEIKFDGSGSTDTPPGQVTEWNFFFGDGTDSGWLPVAYAYYRYPVVGNYTATLTVRDNGGKESTNDAHVDITIKELMGGNMGFYLLDDGDLTLSKPDGSEGRTKPCPNGYTPYPFPASPVGRVEYREIGGWTMDYPLVTRTLVERGTLSFWIRNQDDERAFDAQFRAKISVNEETLLEGETEDIYIEPGSPPLKIDLYTNMTDLELKYHSNVEIALEVKVNGEGLELVYWEQRCPSGFEIRYFPTENDKPHILDAPDVTGSVYEEVFLSVAAEDADGKILEYRWDLDGDLEWDIETGENHTKTVYNVPDEYQVNVMAVDDDGASVIAHFAANIYEWGHNLPPEVGIDFPRNGTTLTGPTVFYGAAWDDTGIKKVLARVDERPWESAYGNETWDYEVIPFSLEVGKHKFSVKAIDIDEEESEIASIVFFVDTPRTPPWIERLEAFPEIVNNSGQGTTVITVRVNDKDGLEDIEYVELDLRVLGLGRKKCTMDRPGTYVLTVAIPMGAPTGKHGISVEVRDRSGLKDTANITLEIVEKNHPPEVEDLTDRRIVMIGKTESLKVSVRVTDPNGRGDVSEVYIDLAPLGVNRKKYLNDDGVLGDGKESDDNYTFEYVLSRDITPGKKTFTITAVDQGGLSGSINITVTFRETETDEAGGSKGYGNYRVAIPIIIILVFGIIYILIRRYKSH